VIVIGSRGSQLALWQAGHIAERLKELGAETRIEIIKTSGDKITDVPLATAGGKGLFTKEIEEALLAGAIDLAVHSLKDMPVELPPGLTLAAIPEREDPRDALVGLKAGELDEGTIVGTSSLRRAAQLREWKPGVYVGTLRGNVDTRLRKLDEGKYDAIILAAAGLRRLGLAGRIAELIPPSRMCPAPGQGALAIETRDESSEVRDFARKLDHPETRAAITAERALLAALGGGCQVPIGAHATVENGQICLIAVVAWPDGRSPRLQAQDADSDPVRLGREVGRLLLEQGARDILDGAYGA
jgi:hydroxymethylbilane synthase